MTSRLDRLITLLDTGSTSSVRQTAAKQLAGVARRALPEHEPNASITQTAAWCEIYDKGWNDIVTFATRVLPYLGSKSTDTRLAAVDAINRIAETVPQWKSSFGGKINEDSAETLHELGWPERLQVEELVLSGRKLAATGEGEYGSIIGKNGVDEQAKQEVLSKLGLKDQLMLGDQDILLDDMEDVKPTRVSSAKRQLSPLSTPTPPQDTGNGVGNSTGRKAKRMKREDSSNPVSRPTSSSGPPTKPASDTIASRPTNIADDPLFAGISARQLNVLKRKMKAGLSYNSAVEETAKMRGGGGHAVSPKDTVETPNPSRASSPDLRLGKSSSNGVVIKQEIAIKSEMVIVDPAAKIAQNIQKGGNVNVSKGVGKDLTPPSGVWAWQAILDWLVEQLAAPGWESRHGAALALRDLLRQQGSACGTVRGVSHDLNSLRSQQCLLHVAQAILRTLILDRFGDFVGDQVVAPVREAAAQALGSVLKLMSRKSVSTVHAYLIDMIAQPWSVSDDGKRIGYAWEVRHAGLLGLMYEVAVRPDIVAGVEATKTHIHQDADVKIEEVEEDLLQRVIDAAMLGLRDADDDVRGVAATCLLPIALSLPSQLPQDQLEHLLEVLWSCLDSGEDDLSSSTASVMDLLSRLVSSPHVIKFYASSVKREGQDSGHSLAAMIPLLFPFFRHTITGVRLATVKALAAFLDAADLRKDWLDSRLMRMLYQNLILEERLDVRDVTIGAWNSALRAAEERGSTFEEQVLPHFVNWFSLALTPVNGPLPTALLLRIGRSETSDTYDVDKSMVAGDLSLLSLDVVIRNRIEAVTALARISCRAQDAEMALGVVNDFTVSTSGHQLFLCGVFLEEKAIADQDFLKQQFIATEITDQGERALGAFMDLLVNGFRLPHYFESANLYSTLKRSFELAVESVSTTNGSGPLSKFTKTFTIESARGLLEACQPSSNSHEQIGIRLANLAATLERHEIEKLSMDIRVLAAAAAAVVATRILPPKLNPLIQSLMRGVKSETNTLVQRRFARALASLIKLCVDPDYAAPPAAANKILINLTSFLCQDAGFIPQVAASPTTGIVTHRKKKPVKTPKSAAPTNGEEAAPNEDFVTRRGAQAALSAIIDAFGAEVFDKVPKLWDLMTQALLARFSSAGCDVSVGEAQEVVDCICVLQAIGTGLPISLQPRLQSLLPNLLAALQSKIPLVRHVSAVTFARLCQDITLAGMTAVVENVMPLLADATDCENRQGAIELIHHITLQLDVLVLPYILFLLVPVMGRMSDSNEDVRLLSTNTFASLIRLVPLEEDIPDPEGFPQEMMERREAQRSFLRQLLDGSQVEPYVIPVDINAEVRHYQQDGVSWLAFLCKYQLHGILCDDMGLGKSLQTICIVASKHEERRIAYAATPSAESQPLPSLIVCPPTLVGHWFHEFKKFAPHLRVLRYAGNARERQALRGSVSEYEVIITSYEVIRSEGELLSSPDWLFCVLDEGHIIKNGKTKLSKAIKLLRANHRLILSGTPIQNNVLELWNLFDFLMPGFLGTEKQFSDRFWKPIMANRSGKATPKEQEAAILALDALHKQVLPFLLRRLKEDVLDDLPPKIIQDYYCDLSLVQKRLYDEFSRSKANQQAGSAVSGATEGSGEQQHVFQTLQYLRKLCNHPWLAVNQQTDQLEAIIKRAWADASQKPPTDVLDIVHAPKLVALRQILLDCGIGAPVAASDEAGFAVEATSQHRVLIFCQARQMLDIVERDLFAKHMPSVTFMRLDGSTETSKRHDIVQTFNADPSVDVLLLTTQVGGLGLNLTGADTVVFVDHDWNPMKDLQAMDRAHRIGQKKVVNVYRLIMRGTLEEKIMGLQRFKLNIASSVVNEQNSGLATMNTNQVLDLFDVTDSDATASTSKTDGVTSQSDLLKGLEDLPPESEYEGLSLDAFMSTI